MKIINKIVISGIFLSMVLVLSFIAPATTNAQYYLGNGCINHLSARCNGNNLYWYDSCGNQQDIAQYCTNSCYNNLCQDSYNNNNYNNNYNTYRNCTYHAYKFCIGNNVYWYDSCGTQQDLNYTCTGNQVCQYGQCTFYVQPVQPIQPINNYIAYYKTACYNNSIHWYDSLGTESGLYKNCQDANSCTIDTCSGSKCLNTLKCDGSTCATGSADYNTYCSTTPVTNQKCGNGLCETTLGETTANCPNDCKITVANGLSISFLSKQDATSAQWQKTSQIGSNSQIYFMVAVSNSSTTQIDNVNVSANIPTEISSLGNLQLNGVLVSGDIVSGISIGSISPNSTKSITFEGKTQTISSASTKSASASVNISGSTSTPTQSDTVSVNFNPSQVIAAVSTTPETPGFLSFLKQWYLWILAALVLVFLFVVVFKRFSSEV